MIRCEYPYELTSAGTDNYADLAANRKAYVKELSGSLDGVVAFAYQYDIALDIHDGTQTEKELLVFLKLSGHKATIDRCMKLSRYAPQ